MSEYYEFRKTRVPGAAWMGVVRGTCYPGLKELLAREKAMTMNPGAALMSVVRGVCYPGMQALLDGHLP